ncbi:hypothetical protein LTR17_018356 [Elasticomyces elasticus]|nr:hypothetical protein LTR17_018356 [Elasticomyces elasticus]
MAVGPIDHGTVESVPGYGAEHFKGTVANGADVFYVESTSKSVRLDFRSVIRVPAGDSLYFSFIGYIEGNADTATILRGSPDAKSTSWGSSFLSGTFETGNPKWMAMNRKIYVGSQRLIREPDKPLIVEINLSEVVSPSANS